MANSTGAGGRNLPAVTVGRAGERSGGVSAAHYMREIMQGRMTVDDVPCGMRAAVASAVRFPVYQLACQVLAAGGIDARRAMLAGFPDSVRGMVEVEARRVFALRRDNNRIT